MWPYSSASEKSIWGISCVVPDVRWLRLGCSRVTRGNVPSRIKIKKPPAISGGCLQMRAPERPPAHQTILLSKYPRAWPMPPPEMLPSAFGQAGFPDLAPRLREGVFKSRGPGLTMPLGHSFGLPVDGPLGSRLRNFSDNARAPLQFADCKMFRHPILL